jgi:glutamate synthase domain-containing protein 2/glutamate synthase domain-containing protein 1/glutamate synthase domain-containing protein 3
MKAHATQDLSPITNATDAGQQPAQRALPPPAQGLYDPAYEKDACGVGFVCNVRGVPSHAIVEQAIEVLENLLHRGAAGADAETGDGAGILVQIPDRFYRDICGAIGIALPAAGRYGVAMMFLPTDEEQEMRVQKVVEKTLVAEGVRVLGWRKAPMDASVIGRAARDLQPAIRQCFVCADGLAGDALERKLYVARRQCEKAVAREVPGARFYIPSFSSRTVVYKGLMQGTQVSGFYLDLNDDRFESGLAVVHQRYSTNTFPSWELAQPFRYLAHNGEINTLRGNLNWMRSRERNLKSDLFGDDLVKLLPIIDEKGSDSACLDNTLELLVNGGRDIEHAMLMLVPQAWGAKCPIGPDLRGFFEYHAGLMEPWDGPAALAFTDGRMVGALLDRNGLRPARYTITKDGFMVLASEAGVLDIPAGRVQEKGGLRPGQSILVDFRQQRVLKDTEIKMRLARRQPYRRWVEENKITIHGWFGAVAPVAPDPKTLLRREKYFGYTREDLKQILDPMATTGHEPVGSMGTDEPLAVLSEQPQLLYWYFKQLFAQVTNPAIDSIREELVMSLMTFIGTPDNILTESPQHARLLKLPHPFLTNEDLDRIRTLNYEDFASKTLAIGFKAGGNGKDLEAALEDLCVKAEAAVSSGYRIIILSDRNLPEDQMAIPALLAVSAVNQHLARRGLRTAVGIIIETGEAREVMHMATLLGYGASAINPYLAFEIVADMALNGRLSKPLTVTKAMENYIKSLCKGLLKIMSKMGISTLRSYRSAQVFEAIGLNSDVIQRYFEGTVSRIEGIGLEEIAREANARYALAFSPPNEETKILPSGGHYSYRKDGERHLWNPDTVFYLQQATRNNDYELYRKYAELINNQQQRQYTLRGLFRFKPSNPIPLEEVEPESEIVKRFVTGAMSYGSISEEAHKALAIAMNRIGGKSNSGEGGEDPERYVPLPNGDSTCSAIKQVASGRFGVTAEYLINAQDLQIKIAQGAKPGEGGQLPGDKVYPWIAKTRHSTPYVSLISPPPHHDIYSIEDIKQLIYDLKCSNPDARVSVKLVAEVGVGTVAAGVAKAHADVIVISGYDGGTGASPLSSLRHAGVPWELGLAETQQTLVVNDLRRFVRLQTDGQIKTGRDVVIAAMLGAEEFGFATTALVVLGCVMMRCCHKNTCPVGVATQDPILRKFFSGKPEYVVHFMHFVAREAREIMAQLGFRKLDDLVGRSDLLEMNEAITFWKARGLDFNRIFYRPDAPPEKVRQTVPQRHELETALDWQLLPRVQEAIDHKKPVEASMPIRNVHRTVGTLTSSRIAKKYGRHGLPDDTITLKFRGTAGQSFAAFCSKGMTFILEGEANDYLGKGLSGAKVIVKPVAEADYEASGNLIIGNVALYGATAGEAYICGQAGERFAIRNSGALAVVEGVGDHGCEYMTGGRVVILGPTGVNFGAGMSGGIAYVYDTTGHFDERCNLEMIDLELVADSADQQELRRLIQNHVLYTGSRHAQHILDHWDECLPYFVKVFPMDYKKALGRLSREDAVVEREEVVRD